jgi:putative ABC transport system substrate-binding protein
MRLPTMFYCSGVCRSGRADVLQSDFLDLYLRTAELVDKILRGAKPADLPVEQPIKFDLIVNLTTARRAGAATSATKRS